MHIMMKNEDVLAAAIDAYKKGEMMDLLSGAGKYACPVDKMVSASVPTDWSRILEEGIFALYKSTQDSGVITSYKTAIKELAGSNNVVSLWIAYHVCWSHLYKTANGQAPFLLDDVLLRFVRFSVLRSKDKLKCEHVYQGQQLKLGLWEDICIADWNLKNKAGSGIL